MFVIKWLGLDRMKREQMIILGLGSLLVGMAAAWEIIGGMPRPMKVEITKETIGIGHDHPPLWIFLNDSDTNTRQWSDFMARSSNVINIPILNLFYHQFLLLLN